MIYYNYVSTQASWDCIQTIFLCVPGEYAGSMEKAEEYARRSGWVQTAENNAAVLIVPLAENGWKTQDVSWIPEFYDLHKNDFKAPGGVSIPGRDGILWLWETMIYLAGYEDGADYAAEVLTAHPGFFAASLLKDGKIGSYEYADLEASHWFVRKPSDYSKKNCEIGSAVWMCGNIDESTRNYFENIPGSEVQVSEEVPSSDTVMNTLFNHTLRWKNSPDGEIRHYLGKKDYAESERYHHDSVTCGGLEYPFTVYLPEGMTKENMPVLPVVFSIHGRGEPTWVFAEKNGWQALADETREFMVVYPDSRYNIWSIERDKDAIRTILEKVMKDYRADSERVYLSGFSNGAVFTCQQASTYPELFAVASPWNGPGMEACVRLGIDPYVYHEAFKDSGYDMPFWICVGDSDGKASADREDELDILIPVNHCVRTSNEVWDGTNHYTKENGYTDGERFTTRVFRTEDGSVRVGLTVMKNMPHGAVWDESRAAWEFMKKFRRPAGSKQTAEVKE
ncbi:MAG: hypothetical protein IIZ57_03610 [Solobacterium sp.]|nr:hypothetical protein [Solobacterium sp.]